MAKDTHDEDTGTRQTIIIATPQEAARLDAVRRLKDMKDGDGKRLDEAKRPGGEYLTADGRKVDAEGRSLDKDADPASQTPARAAAAVDEIKSEGELDALEAKIKARRETIAAEKEAEEERLAAVKRVEDEKQKAADKAAKAREKEEEAEAKKAARKGGR